jgi:hypothetical protein
MARMDWDKVRSKQKMDAYEMSRGQDSSSPAINLFCKWMGKWMVKCYLTAPSVGDTVLVTKKNGMKTGVVLKALMSNEGDIRVFSFKTV